MVTPEEAWERLEAALEPLTSERVERRTGLGRRLAAPLAATVDVPPTDVSAMDGYCLTAAAAAGDQWPVVGVIAAGDPPGFELPPGRAARIMTGAPVPTTAETVVPVENTDGGKEEVELLQDAAAGLHIRRQGEILASGDPLFPAGALLTSGALSLAATHGHSEVSVFRRPRVAILTTGDEIVPADRVPGPGQLRDSHTDFLLAAGRDLGYFQALGIAPDRLDALRESVREGLEADVLLVCGGVSMGEFDFVESVLENEGCRILFDSVALQPGKPLVAARHDRGWVFGLPGNPGSVMATFWLFVRPLLRRLQGHPDGFWHGALSGVLAAALPGAGPRDRFLPAAIETQDGILRVHPVAPKGSHDTSAFAQGTALVRVAAGSSAAPAGEACEVLLLTASC